MGTKVWLNGRELTNGEAVKLDVGLYPLLMEVSLGKVPPMLKVGTTMSFDTIEDPTEALARWQATARASLPALQQILDEKPNKQVVGHAKRIISAIE